MRLRLAKFLALVVLGAVYAPQAGAQSIVAGSVDGVVTSSDGGPVSGASVVLRFLGKGLERFQTTGSDGRFAIPFVAPGSYELLVEALGFRPALVRPVDMPVGEAVNLSLMLERESGVVARVDTIRGRTQVSSRWTTGGEQIRPNVVDAAPGLTNDLSAVASLVSAMDGSLGAQGLPGSMTSIFIDGVRFDPVIHPALRGGGSATPLIGRTGTAWIQAFLTPPDLEWGGQGSVLSVTSRTGTSSGAPLEVAGAWSGDPVWTSTELDFEAPALTSVWASARAELDLVADTSRLFIAADGMRLQTPRAPHIGVDAAAALGQLDGALVDALSRPSVEEVTRASGLARLDWWFSAVQRFTLRAAVGREERIFTGPGVPLLEYGATPGGTATDFSVVADLTNQQSEALTLEFRAGLSGSFREYEEGETAQALVAGPGLLIGTAAGSGGSASRLDFNFAATAHYRLGGGGALKGGGQLRATRHSLTHTSASGGRYLFPELTSLSDGPGSFVGSVGPETTFPSSQASAFGQYAWAPGQDVRFTLGARLDYETIPAEATLNGVLREATGLDNSEFPTSFISPGVGASATWELTGAGGRAALLVAGSLQQGDMDPAFLAELFVQDGATRTARFIGRGTGWPGASGPTGAANLPTITLFGPDTRPPQHIHLNAGLLTRLSPSTSIYTGAAFRRTDFLPRRRNLNLAVTPSGVDANGRAIWGDLQKEGSLVLAADGTYRRFAEFDAVWALDPDGWSEYRAATVGIEHRSDAVDLFASYTRSMTEDNWLGAGSGMPEAAQPPTIPDTVESWTVGTSDFDIPDRAVAGATLSLGGGAAITAVYRYASGRPFTPGYRRGVDANADGSGFNDPAWVPIDLGTLSGDWPCLADMVGAFATRNSCRGPAQHGLDARVELRLGTFLGRGFHIAVDGLNLVESTDGVRDTALLLVDPDAPLTSAADGSQVSVPVLLNPGFGSVVFPYSPGRIIRLGVRLGG